MAKSNNSLPVSMVFDYIRKKPGKKAVILALDDLDESKSSERIGWIYDTDYAFLNDENIVQIIALSLIHILMQYLTGQTVIETTAKVMTLNKHDDHGNFIGVDDNALCILRMNGGAVGTLAASWTVYGLSLIHIYRSIINTL